MNGDRVPVVIFVFFNVKENGWVKEKSPRAFAKAREIEKSAGDGYTWVRGKNLDELVEHAEKREKRTWHHCY